jgi:hypothetical protein
LQNFVDKAALLSVLYSCAPKLPAPKRFNKFF